MDLVIQCVTTKYADFTGRASRKEYWLFVLFAIIASLILGFIDGITGLIIADGIGILSLILSLALIIPGLAAGVRRLHDIDKSGWWMLLGLIPLVGGLALLVMFCLPGTQGANRFGAQP